MTGRPIDGTELLLREREARSLTLLMAVVLACVLPESVKFAIDSMTARNKETGKAAMMSAAVVARLTEAVASSPLGLYALAP